MMKPSNFTSWPMDSLLQSSEHEIIARNIMIILKRTGDDWRELTFEEYAKHRLLDGAGERQVEGEKTYFDKVLPYCKSAVSAKKFANLGLETIHRVNFMFINSEVIF